jgi:hypothetical protein
MAIMPLNQNVFRSSRFKHNTNSRIIMHFIIVKKIAE